MVAHTAYVGIGSNLGNPLDQVSRAFLSLHNIPATDCLALSGLFDSSPVGPGNQPNYVNAVAKLSTRLAPLELLGALQAIEGQQKRVRTLRWGARTLDLDLLLYGDRRINEPLLTVPHPRLSSRNFVLAPLLDLAPDLVLPDGTLAADYLARCGYDGLKRLRPADESAR